MNDLSLAPENYLSSAFKASLKSLEKNTPIYSLNLLGGATFFFSQLTAASFGSIGV
jgi:hypothetical protein